MVKRRDRALIKYDPPIRIIVRPITPFVRRLIDKYGDVFMVEGSSREIPAYPLKGENGTLLYQVGKPGILVNLKTIEGDWNGWVSLEDIRYKAFI